MLGDALHPLRREKERESNTSTARSQVRDERELRYAVAVAAVLALVLLRLALTPVLGDQFRFMILFPAVVFSAWYGGLGTGFVATGLSAGAAAYLLNPTGAFAVRDPDDLTALCLFLIVGGFISLVSENLIHARRRLEGSLASLGESEERFRTMFELASVGKAEIDLAGQFLRVNRRLCEITGYPAEELLALRFMDLTHADDRERDLATFRRLAAGEINEYATEKRYCRKDGSVVWVEVTAALSRDSRGAPRSSIAVVRDISDRKRAEQALEQRACHAALAADIGVALTGSATSREMLQRCAEAIVRHLDAAFARVWILNSDTNVLELQASAGLYTRLDGTHGRVPFGKLKIGWIAAERKPYLTNAVIGDPQVSDQDWARREGMVAFAGYPLVVEDRLVGVMGMFARAPLSAADLGALGSVADEIAVGVERRKGETALRESEERFRLRTVELEMANKELEAFSYSVSHDLRNPLGIVEGYNHVLLTAYAAKLDRTGRECLERVRAVTDQMAQLIDDLLQFSLARRAELRHDTVDLSALAQTVVAELRQMDPERQVTISIAPGLTATGDRGLLRVVLRNLLGNAWKFTKTQPQPSIDLGAVYEDGTVAYCVRDNGVGFDIAKADKLFGTFQRLHSAQEFPGTGIGLATVQRIVQRHGGRVWAEAAVGKGAAFYFTLP